MINILDKKDCVGCNGCVQCCPQQCISFNEDEQGFRYPKVDIEKCVECGLCEKVCPVINQGDERKPLSVYAGHIVDKDILYKSSSGGIFSALAHNVLRDGGIVFGARFDDEFNIIHDSVETIDDLSVLRGSKYVQSYIGECYQRVKQCLKGGRQVLFSGTPCQIAGLKFFLGKEYENLLLVEVICHGVPSPRVWREYLTDILKDSNQVVDNISCNLKSKYNHIKRISFRDKRRGWEKYGFSIAMSDLSEKYLSIHDNNYMQVFLRDLDLRPSCYSCPSKNGKSQSDIILGDFWKVSNLEPEAYSQDGTSLILINTEKGEKAIIKTEVPLFETVYSKALQSNESLILSASMPKYYNFFWENFYNEGITSLHKTLKRVKGGFLKRLVRYVKRRMNFLSK